jgi:hypothetical protein
MVVQAAANDVDGREHAAETAALASSLERKLIGTVSALEALPSGSAHRDSALAPFLSLIAALRGLVEKLADGRRELARSCRIADRAQRASRGDPLRTGAVMAVSWLIAITLLPVIDLNLEASGRFVLALFVLGASSALALAVLRAQRWIRFSSGWSSPRTASERSRPRKPESTETRYNAILTLLQLSRPNSAAPKQRAWWRFWRAW